MKSGFNASDNWPLKNAREELQRQAIENLIANHSLIVGQSRSGKTTAARRLIEEILLWTKARVVILDPNADFKWLAEPEASTDDLQFSNRWSKLAKRIEVATPDTKKGGIYWGNLSTEEKAAFLRLNPKDTFAEYRHLQRHIEYQSKIPPGITTLSEFTRSQYFEIASGDEVERYRLLLEELARVPLWASGKHNDLDTLLGRKSRATVIDLSMNDEQVRTIIMARTLERLWSQGETHRRSFLAGDDIDWAGTLVVIDEAHLFAPPETNDPRKQSVSDRIKRFADQGKKLNLYLMLLTQQPGKLHRDVLSECNNRVIMRVNERRSLVVLEETYGGVAGRYDGALTFNPGEALMEGTLLTDENPPPVFPRGVTFAKARTREGGGTPKRDWARP